MKIELDQQEVSNILIGWAKDKYKTHNVSVEELTNNKAIMLVTPNESEYSPATEQLVMEKFNKLQAKYGNTAEPSSTDLADQFSVFPDATPI